MAEERQVPYTPFPTVRPEAPATPRIHEEFPEVRLSRGMEEALSIVGHGMGTLGQAYQAVGQSYDKLGAMSARAGNELFQRAEALKSLEIDKEVDKATISNYKAQGENADEFLKLAGDQASPEAYRVAADKGTKVRQQIEDSLGSEEAKRRYRAESRGTMGNEFRRMSQHMSNEQKNGLDRSTSASILMYKDKAAKADNVTDYKTAFDAGKALIEGRQRHIKGWDDNATKEVVSRYESDVITDRAKLMSEKNPEDALQYLEANEKKVMADRYDDVHKNIRHEMYRVEGRNLGARAGADPKVLLEEQLKKGDELAEAARPGDPELRTSVRNEIRTNHNLYKEQVRQDTEQRRQTVDDALYGFRHPDGKAPTSREELFVWPDVKAAYEGSTPDEKKRIDTILLKNSQGDIHPNAVTDLRKAQLEGIMINDPYTFRDMNLLNENLPRADRNELRKIQIKMIKEGLKVADDPRTKKAFDAIMHGGAVAMPDDLKKPGDQRDLFMGMLRQSLIVAEQHKKGPLTEKEIQEVGKIILRKMPGTGYFGSDWGTTEFWQQMRKEVPQAKIDAYKRADPTATDEEILEFEARRRFKEEFNKLHGAAGR